MDLIDILIKALSMSPEFKLRDVLLPPLSQTPKNSFKRWPSPRNDLVVSNKLTFSETIYTTAMDSI